MSWAAAKDNTGFDKGGVNSGDFYKLYNNEQLKSAQKSNLGVAIGSSVVAAIGQADDVILAANNLYNPKLLARVTEIYCTNYRVKLVASKTYHAPPNLLAKTLIFPFFSILPQRKETWYKDIRDNDEEAKYMKISA